MLRTARHDHPPERPDGPLGGHPKRLKRDPLYAARIGYCAPRGIALDDFLAWPQASQDAALEWAAREAQRCQSCGTWHDEWDLRNGVHPWHPHIQVCPGQKVMQDLAGSDRMKNAGHGVQVVLAQGPPQDCPTCNPID